MRTYTATDVVNARPETLWRFLSDVAHWPDYLDTVESVEPLDHPELALDRQYRVRQPGLKPAVWEVVSLDAPWQFTWRARSPGIVLLADHRIDRVADDQCRLHLGFGFGGLIGWPLALLFGSKTRHFFQSEIVAMKRLAEGAG